MSEPRDKRRRNDLDLFVLALIDSGISTPYALQKEAGLSPGATIPAIQRLLLAGHVRQRRASLRGKTEHRVTAAGRKHLTQGWYPLIEKGPTGDLDADLRIALVALCVGGKHKLAVDFLRQSAEKMLKSSEAESAEYTPEAPSQLASWYRKLRGAAAKALLEEQSAAVLVMADRFPSNPPQKRKSGLSTTATKRS
jgi:hypothetical protein